MYTFYLLVVTISNTYILLRVSNCLLAIGTLDALALCNATVVEQGTFLSQMYDISPFNIFIMITSKHCTNINIIIKYI